jgi:5-methylcytosine-specific restriction protein A
MPGRIERYRPKRLKAEPPTAAKHYHTADWKARRVRILVRDAYRCRACGRVVYGVEAHVDHVRPLADGGTDADDNLQVLCKPCHGAKTRDEQRR